MIGPAPIAFRLLGIAAVLALLASCEPYSRSNSGVSALEKKVLYDFRAATAPAPRLDQNAARKVLSSVSPQYAYQRDCPASISRYQTPVFWISGHADGSFTAPGSRQSAYLVYRVSCGPENSGPTLLVILSGDKLVASAEIPGTAFRGSSDTSAQLLKTFDLNANGTNELLLAISSVSSQNSGTTAELVEISNGKLTTIEDFGAVYHSPCEGFAPMTAQQKELRDKAVEPVIDAVVLWYLPQPSQQMPNFTAQRFRADCPAPGQQPQWKEIAR